MGKKFKWLLFYISTIITMLAIVNIASQTVTVLSESAENERNTCIIIDPGHGGEDGGAISITGQPESKFNLEISVRLNDLLQLLGYDTKMIRTSDVSIYTEGESLSQKKISDLKERVRIINDTENGLLLSIHQNHFPDPRYIGAQVFYAGTQGSELLAKQLQSALISAMNPGNNRKIKKISGVYLMEHIQCPGVLIECGFLSNAAEENNLTNPDYQKKLSCVIATSVSQYVSNT